MLVLETPDSNNLIILLSHLALASFAFLPLRRNHPPRATLFKTNQPIQRPHLLPPPTSGFHTPGHDPAALVTSGPDVRQLGAAPVLQMLEWFSLVNPKPVFPASPISSHGKHDKGFCPQVFPLWLPSASLWPSGAWCVFSHLGPACIINYFSNVHCLLTCRPYHPK